PVQFTGRLRDPARPDAGNLDKPFLVNPQYTLSGAGCCVRAPSRLSSLRVNREPVRRPRRGEDHRMIGLRIAASAAPALLPPAARPGPAKPRFKPEDVSKLDFASDPQVSPDGKRVVYVRNFLDVMKDRRRSNLWVVNADGTGHQPLTTGSHGDASPRW